MPLKLPSPVRHYISCSPTLGGKGPTCLFYASFRQQPYSAETMCSYLRLQSGSARQENDSEETGATVAEIGPTFGPVMRLPEGCACALCWSPWQGLGAKTRLSRLVLNFLPFAPADSPLALRGSLRRQGWGEPEVWQSCLRPRTGRSLPTSLPPASTSSRHLLTLPSWERPPRPGCVQSRRLAGLPGGDRCRGKTGCSRGRLGVLRRVPSPRAPAGEGPLPSFLSLKFRKASSAPLPCFQTAFAFEP